MSDNTTRSIPFNKRAFCFFRGVARDEGRFSGVQIGVATCGQGDDANYQVSYVEVGVRADHLVDPLMRKRHGNDNQSSVDSPIADDSDLVSEFPSVKKAAKKAKKTAQKAAAQTELTE